MTMTDPIADMLTRVRNANTAFHDTVEMPHSKLKGHIAEILKQEGYIAGFKVADAPEGQVGLRVYAKSTGMPRVLGGLGVAIISTSNGLLTDRQATKRGVGGEVLAYVW
jgi:small subunit ribosomal protein S8